MIGGPRTWKANHSILLGDGTDIFGRLCRLAIIPREGIRLCHLCKFRIQFGGLGVVVPYRLFTKGSEPVLV